MPNKKLTHITKTINIKEIKKHNYNLSPDFYINKVDIVNDFFKTHGVNNNGELVKYKTKRTKTKNITEKLDLKETQILAELIKRSNCVDELSTQLNKLTNTMRMI